MSGPNLQAHRRDPGWPVGYPYRCRQGWSNVRVPGPRSLTIATGVEGKVIRRHPHNSSTPDWVEVTMPFENPPGRAWVPFSYLMIGTDYKYNEVNVYIPDPVTRASQVLNQGHTTKDQLRKALEQLALAFRDNIDICPWFPPWFTERITNDDQRRNIIDVIYTGLVPALRQVLNRRDFTIRQVVDALTPVTENDTKPAVYTRIYWDFPSGSKARQYVGKAKLPGQRDGEHIKEAKRERSNRGVHYSAMNASRRKIMGVVSYINEYHVRAVAEQFFVNLFQCHTSAVFNYTAPKPGSNISEHMTTGEFQAQSDRIAKYMMDREQATTLTQIANRALQSVGWPGAKERASYGAGDGCNWNAPIAEMFNREKIIWVRQSFRGQNLDVFRRQPLKIGASQDSKGMTTRYVILASETESKSTLGGYQRGTFFAYLPKEMAGLETGTWVYPVVEMTQDGSPHHLSWTRLPSVGPWADWDKARSWALKLEWQSADGGWHSNYLGATRIFDLRGRPSTADRITREPGAYNPYAHGIAIYRYLRQIDLQQVGRPTWQYDYGVARVKHQWFDFITHTFQLREQRPNPFNSEHCVPRDHPMDMVTKYHRAGLNAGVQFGTINNPSSKVRAPRGGCDQCYLMNVKERFQDVYGVSRCG